MNLDGKRILLTGASGGIGEALAQQLAERGAHLLLHGRREAPLRDLQDRLPHPECHQWLCADLAQGLRQLAHEPLLAGGIDILINNAGTNHFAWLEDQSEEQIRAQLELNTLAPILLTRLLLPRLRRPGIVMNIGSSFGAIGYPGYSAYCASKFALRGFSEALARELEGSGIRVIHFAPRATRTHLNTPEVYAMNAALGTRTDTPQEVARLAIESLEQERLRTWVGWPEKLFVRLNALLPGLVDKALAKQHATISRFAHHLLHKEG
ncbi:SDR family oxidoreductase [Aeromonas schubertii]|uniref:SDR family oxidoreductase n=1 Tax=Aeromonas schubertii TaxID=652 RepID=UPI001CC65BB7|nr:SDR family oxidoreductase [Aeromonas schubertii]MBZ6071132.1 SDR family oxidoreductase [Aeromonas schubertii]